VPVISTAVSGIPELVIDEQTGLLVNPRDAAALAAALARVLDDEALRWQLAAGAARHVRREFDLAANTERLRALLLSGGVSTLLSTRHSALSTERARA
jgi:glycosyltransferase involved in cell wall biosynthesis